MPQPRSGDPELWPDVLAARGLLNKAMSGQSVSAGELDQLPGPLRDIVGDYAAITQGLNKSATIDPSRIKDPGMKEWATSYAEAMRQATSGQYDPSGISDPGIRAIVETQQAQASAATAVSPAIRATQQKMQADQMKMALQDSSYALFNLANDKIPQVAAQLPAPMGGAPRPIPQAKEPISYAASVSPQEEQQPTSTGSFNAAAPYVSPYGRYSQIATEFYLDPERAARGIRIGASGRPEFENTLQGVVNGDYNAVRQALNSFNGGNKPDPSRLPQRPEYRACLTEYEAAMEWTKGDMKGSPPDNRFSGVLGKADDLRRTAEAEYPKAKAALENWRMASGTRPDADGKGTVVSIGEGQFKTPTQKTALGDFRITAEYLLNSGSDPQKRLSDYRMNTPTSDPYNLIMRGYVAEYAKLRSNPDPAAVEKLRDVHIEKARDQALQDLESRGMDFDKRAVVRELKTAGNKEVSRIQQEIEKDVMSAFEKLPFDREVDPSLRNQQQQPGLQLTR